MGLASGQRQLDLLVQLARLLWIRHKRVVFGWGLGDLCDNLYATVAMPTRGTAHAMLIGGGHEHHRARAHRCSTTQPLAVDAPGNDAGVRACQLILESVD